jgi:hypothetical protein
LNALEAMMQFARTNGFLGDCVTRIPHRDTTASVCYSMKHIQL